MSNPDNPQRPFPKKRGKREKVISPRTNKPQPYDGYRNETEDNQRLPRRKPSPPSGRRARVIINKQEYGQDQD